MRTLLELLTTRKSLHSVQCISADEFWRPDLRQCEPCKNRHPIKPGFEFTSNCGWSDDEGRHEMPYKPCSEGSFNDGTFTWCQPCSSCPSSRLLSHCTNTSDTRCCDEGQRAAQGECREVQSTTARTTAVTTDYLKTTAISYTTFDIKPTSEIIQSFPSKTIPTLPDKTTPTPPVKTTPTPPDKTTPTPPVKTTPTPPDKTTPNTPVKTTPTPPAKTTPTHPVKTIPKDPVKTIPTPPAKTTPNTPVKTTPTHPAKTTPTHPVKTIPKDPVNTIPTPPVKTTPTPPAKTIPKDPVKTHPISVNIHTHHPDPRIQLGAITATIVLSVISLFCLFYIIKKRKQQNCRDLKKKPVVKEENCELLKTCKTKEGVDINNLLSPEIQAAPLQTVLNNLDVVEELVLLLDPDTPGAKNTRHLASNCSIPFTWINYAYSMRDSRSPLIAVLEKVIAENPCWKVGDLAGLLSNIGRNDAVAVLGKLTLPVNTKM